MQHDTPHALAVARLTTRITQLAEHMRIHKKDYASRRGLEAVIAQRRALLQYLRRKDFGAYAQLISRLGLRDTYAKLVSPLQTGFRTLLVVMSPSGVVRAPSQLQYDTLLLKLAAGHACRRLDLWSFTGVENSE